MWPQSAWSSLAAILFVVNLGSIVLAQSDDDPYNLKKFNDMRLNEPKSLCMYLTCIPPVKECPAGTSWTENVAMYGCCGGCVRFITDGVAECTGSIDPMYGGGYCDDVSCPKGDITRTAEKPSNSTSFKASLRTTTSTDADGNNIIESSWCGYGFQCTDYYGFRCLNPNGGCDQTYNALEAFMKSDGYDHYRDDYLVLPDCTPEGAYKPKQCKGPMDEERCVCVDPSGSSIFGSAFPFQEELYETMNCECSRRVWEQQNYEGIESPTLHCLDNGNYEPLQCENGYCYCIDPNTTLTYGPTVPEKAMFILPCYNTTILGENNKYLRLCESEYHAHITLASFMNDKGVNQVPLTSLNCDPDGSYGGLQCSGTCKCVDKTGAGYTENIQYPQHGCTCLRDKALLDSAGQTFEPICRGQSGGYYDYHTDPNGAYCVDANGIRSSPKVRQEFCGFLQCNAASYCLANGQTDDENDPKNCEKSCKIGDNGLDTIPCPPCVYISYQGDMSECTGPVFDNVNNIECTDNNHGNA